MTHRISKHAIFPAALFLIAAPQIAAAQSGPLSGLYACEVMSDSKAQLSCFLRETMKLRAAEESAADIITPQQTLITPLPSVAEPKFAPLAKEKAKSAKSQTVAIRSTSKTAKGYTRFTLENGEVWEQIESARVRLGKSDTDALTIKRKSFGSFIGTVNGKRPSFRVRRVA